MKNLIIVLCLAFAIPMVGCGMMKQSSRTHSAIEQQTSFEVDSVLVKSHNGKKSVDVFVTARLNDDQKAMIIRVVKTQIPEAGEIKVMHKDKKPVKK